MDKLSHQDKKHCNLKDNIFAFWLSDLLCSHVSFCFPKRKVLYWSAYVIILFLVVKKTTSSSQSFCQHLTDCHFTTIQLQSLKQANYKMVVCTFSTKEFIYNSMKIIISHVATSQEALDDGGLRPRTLSCCGNCMM